MLCLLTSTFDENVKQVVHLLAGTAILLGRASAGLASYLPGELPPPATPLAAGSPPSPQGWGCYLSKNEHMEAQHQNPP